MLPYNRSINPLGHKINLSDAQYDSASKLQIIQTLSAGFDHIDLTKAKKRNVYVANNNGGFTVAHAPVQ